MPTNDDQTTPTNNDAENQNDVSETSESSTDTTDEQTQNQEATEVNWEEEAKKWKALSRKNESQAKANAEKAKKFDALEDANKTAEQKAQDEIERLKKEARDALVEAIAAKADVPPELLTGNTREELEESAKALTEWRGTVKAPAGSGTDAAGKRGGSINTDQLTKNDLQNMTPEQIDAARKAGRLDQLMGKNRS